MLHDKKIIILVSLFFMMSSFVGCQKIKRVFRKPPAEGITEKSYTIPIYAYRTSVVIKATPGELTEYITDLSRLQESSRAMGLFQVRFEDSVPDIKAIEVGLSIDVIVKLMGLSLDCRIIVLNFRPDKELWLMILTQNSWALGRIEVTEISGGSRADLNVIGYASESLVALVDAFQLEKAVAERVDLWTAIVQSEFDPSLDVRELTGKGLRGELYRELLQVHGASVWVNAAPEEVVDWMAENFETYMLEIKPEEDCISFPEYARMPNSEVIYCPSRLEFLGLDVDVGAFFARSDKGRESNYQVYLQGQDQIGVIEIGILPEAGGSRVSSIVYVEIPGAASPGIMDMMMALAAVPKRLRKAQLDIKHGVEGSG